MDIGQWLHEDWWQWPLIMCLVLTGIHGYLGIHVLKRKVIFVDLAMAQIAALGAAFAMLLDYDPRDKDDALPIYFFSLGFTLVGAAVIALTRMKKEKVPQEAFIGIVYASASAIAMLLLAKTKSETDQIKQMLAGSLLTVQKGKVFLTAAIYSVIGAFHWFFRKKFFAISEDPEAAEKAGISVHLWDFFFYMSFGIVITSSVSIAGVLLVFSYLVVPGVIAVMFAETTRMRIAIAWGVGTLVSVIGMGIARAGDYAPGPPIVTAFAGALVAGGLIHYVSTHERSGVAVGRLAVGAVVVSLAIWGTTFLRKGEETHVHGVRFEHVMDVLKSEDEKQVIDALKHLAETKDTHAVDSIIELLGKKPSDLVLQTAAETLVKLDGTKAVPALARASEGDLDQDLKMHLAQAILDLKDPSGFAVLIKVIETAGEVTRDEALQLVQKRTGKKMDLAELKKWWAEQGPRLKWRSETKRFE